MAAALAEPDELGLFKGHGFFNFQDDPEAIWVCI